MSMKSINFNDIPNAPGIYKFLGSDGKIIYIGKAKSLRKRLKQYFQTRSEIYFKTEFLLKEADNIDFITTKSEYEALLLENQLIKKYKPKFNVRLRDDKTYPYLKITKDEFPSVFITRKLKDDGGIYFGPYTSVKSLKKTLKTIRSIFPVRSCNKKLAKIKKPCLDWEIKICSAPCSGEITKDKYKKLIKGVISFLEGRYKKIINELKKEMMTASKLLEFEKAKVIRDKIFAIEKIQDAERVYFERRLKREESDFLYKKKINIENILHNLKNILKLKSLPSTIEAIDISNIQGRHPTGAVVVFKNGIPDKKEYRRYKIKSLPTLDDYKMIKEVVERRYKRLTEENKILPDLLLIDGGRGHLNSAIEVLRKLGVNIDVISIAKPNDTIFLKDEINPVFLPQTSDELHILQYIRDEAHRFARKYHIKLRDETPNVNKNQNTEQ